MTTSALESYLDLLLARARYGRKLSAIEILAFADLEKINAIESDKSLPSATRTRMIREGEASLGKYLNWARKHGLAQKVADVTSKKMPGQANQVAVFRAYRTVLRREGRPPIVSEWLDEDLKARRTPVNDGYKIKRDLVLREMARRFKLPVTKRSDIRAKPSAS